MSFVHPTGMFLACCIPVAVMALIAGRLADRYPPGLLGGIGLVALGAGMGSLALLGPHATPLDICCQ